MARSATSPLPPPSPDLSSNLDCAFPPFLAGADAPAQRGKSVSGATLDPRSQQRYPGPDPLYAPLSPRLNAGQNIAKRMDTIAPGPFDGRAAERRPATSDGRRNPSQSTEAPSHRRTATQTSARGSPRQQHGRTSMASTASRSSTFSGRSSGLPAHPKAHMRSTEALPPPPAPPIPEKESEGIDAFLSRLQKETMQPARAAQETRSKIYPAPQAYSPGAQPPSWPRRPSEATVLSDDGGPNFDEFPSFETRISRRDDELHLGTAFSLPTPTFDKPAPLNPLQTPSDSGLSEDSNSSVGFRSTASSRSSPPSSQSSGQHSRDVSKISRAGTASEEAIPRVESPESFMDPRTPPQPKRSDPSRPLGASPFVPFAEIPESPMDPAIQRGIFYQRRPSEAPVQKGSPEKVAPPQQPSNQDAKLQPERRPAASKGNCRGCSEQIVGKSVKDSSGRLTGRYHKQCFTCRTCKSPFPSAEFYVFENSPYCEQHYHELNGSLCKACNRGIEGQYLETDQRWKFHPRCFHCYTCRLILRDDYYEVAGKPYCERHAYVAQKNMALGPDNNRFLGTNNLQKRRTRLMMM